MTTIRVENLGRVPYAEVWEQQRKLRDARIHAREADQPADEHLLFVEHEPVYTWGRRTDTNHMGAGPDHLKSLGADVFEVERGGEITFHGPGQLVGYPIAFLGNLTCGRDLHRYMRALEQVVIDVLAEYDLNAGRVNGLTGVWVDGAKVAAMGVRVKKWVSMHGFALNVTTDLDWFSHITPCGIGDRPVTSLERLLGTPPELAEVRKLTEHHFRRVLLGQGL